MLKTVGVAVLVAAGTSYLMAGLQDTPDAGADPALLDMVAARLADVEVRLDMLTDTPREVILQGKAPPPEAGAKDDAATRVAALEKQLAELERRLASGETTPSPGPQRPHAKSDTLQELDAWVERIRRMPTKERQTELYNAGMKMRKLGLYAKSEALLREMIAEAGTDDPQAREAAYQIGWTRSAAKDHAGAREAWLAARDNFPRDHYRFDYSRFYAASSAVRMGDPDLAQRELEELQGDLERAANPDRETILRRTRALLATLGR